MEQGRIESGMAMWVRKRIDIGWSDLARGAVACLRKHDDSRSRRTIGRCWSGGGRAPFVALSVRSGLDLLLSTEGFEPGDEIAMSALTIPDMPRIVREHGLVPVPIDVDPLTLSISEEAMLAALSPRTKGVVVAHLFGGEEQMCRRILAFVRRLGFTARIAVAGSLGAAHALARYGHKPLIHCRLHGEADALAPMPLAALRLDADVLGAAHRLGLERIGDLIAKPRGPLQRRFGETILRRLDQALGRAPEPFEPIVPEDPPATLLGFLEPIATAEAIGEAAGEAVRRLVPLLREQGLGVRRLILTCERVDRDRQEIEIGLARATRDGAHLHALLCARIETIEPGFGIERLHLLAARIEPLPPQPIEGELAGERPASDLAMLVDQLTVRLGERRVHRLSALESDLPERSVHAVGPLADVAHWPDWPRPVRLLHPPEPVDHVIAPLPDGAPARFSWRGRSHRVRAADGPERVFGEWWRRRGEQAAIRDYFQVEDEAGARFWLFRKGDGEDEATGDLSWWLQGVFA